MPQGLKLTILRAAAAHPGTAAATPTGHSSATPDPDARRDNGLGASPHQTPGSSNTDASGPATAVSSPGAAPGASGSRCSYTPPHYWPAPSTTAPGTPGDTLRPSPPPGRRRPASGPDAPHEPRRLRRTRISRVGVAAAATTIAPTPHAVPH